MPLKKTRDMVYYNFYQVIGNIGYPQPGIKEPLQTFKDHLTDESIRSIYHCTLWRKLIRRSHIQAIDFSKMPSINYWEDWVVGVLLTLNEPKIAYLDEYLYFGTCIQKVRLEPFVIVARVISFRRLTLSQMCLKNLDFMSSTNIRLNND